MGFFVFVQGANHLDVSSKMVYQKYHYQLQAGMRSYDRNHIPNGKKNKMSVEIETVRLE